MIDPIVHAALLVVIAWGLKMVALALGVDLGEDVYTSLAGVILAYILSLFGLSLWNRITPKFGGAMGERGYKPPFVG